MKDMLGRQDLMQAGEALGLILKLLPLKVPREVFLPVEETLGMVTSRDIVSPEDLPAFARSTVDGYAVRAADTFGASEAAPAYVNLSGEIFMGEKPGFVLMKGSACKMPTGGMLPDGADAVVMFEHVQPVDKTMIEVLRPAAPGENVIQAGEDVKKGATVIAGGHRLRPQDIGACAGIGITEVHVYERPAVSIISTGDEIMPAGSSLEAGQVRDINSCVLSGMISEAGCLPRKKGIFRDEYDMIRAVVESSMGDSDVILLTGGTSVGIKDMIARVIDDIGNPGVVFHGVSLKPGKPMIGGIVEGIPVFGLPGHPAAVGVCFDVFVRPVLKVLTGCRDKLVAYRTAPVKARLSKNVASAQGREEHVRVSIEEKEDGLWAIPVLGKSGLITTLVKADGTFVIPINKNGIETGEVVDVRLF
ncbi:MAG: molybdopterin molybdotransferase MoeA [Candidatus Sulfobium sp.]